MPVNDQLKIYTDVFENALGYDAGRDVPQYLGYFVQRAEVRGDEPLKFENVKIRSGLGNGKDLPAVTGSTIPAAIADWIQEAEPLLDPNYFHPVLTFPLPALINHDWGPEVVHSDLPLAAETEAEMARMEGEEEDVIDPTAEGEGSIFGNDFGSGRGMGMGEGGMGRRPGMGRGTGRGMEANEDGRRRHGPRHGHATQYGTRHGHG